MKLSTAARFLQPKGTTHQMVGLNPQIEVPYKPNASEEERFVMREGNLIPNVLPPLNGKWQETRPQKLNQLKACINQTGIADMIYSRDLSLHKVSDYQLYKAVDALACDLKLNLSGGL